MRADCWSYDGDLEELRGPDGGVIGRVEPASGPLAAAAPALLEACEAAILALESKDPWQLAGPALFLLREAVMAARNTNNE